MPTDTDEPVEPEQPDDLGDEDADYGIGEPDEDDGGDEPHTALPPRIDAWRRRSASGAVLTGFALGLQSVFEPKRDEPAIVLETSGDPPRDLPVEADMEYRRPRQTVVNIRPWLLDQGRSATTGEPTQDRPAEAEPERGSDGPEDAG